MRQRSSEPLAATFSRTIVFGSHVCRFGTFGSASRNVHFGCPKTVTPFQLLCADARTKEAMKTADENEMYVCVLDTLLLFFNHTLPPNHRTMRLSSFSLALSVVLSSAVGTSLAFTFIGGKKTAHHVTTSSASSSSASTRTTRLFGILDEIEGDSYDLLGNSGANDAKEKNQQRDLSDAYEIFLGELVFSPNDPRVDIVENFDLACDPQFTDWLNKKVESSTDPEEKAALRDLYGMILDVKKKVEINAMAEERAAKEKEEAEAKRIAAIDAEVEAGKAMSNTDVLRKAQAIDSAGVETEIQAQAEEKKTFFDTELTPEIRLSYEDLLKEVLPPYKPGDTADSIAFAYYDKFDAQFVKVLTERSNNGDSDAQDLVEALAVEQSKRIAAATETLKSVLAMGEPMRMEGAIVKLAREGKVDEPFLLLLEANANQAEAAGAQGPAQLMRKLGQRAMAEKDKQSSSKEIKLLRQLLREDDSTARELILEEAFTPKEALIVSSGACVV